MFSSSPQAVLRMFLRTSTDSARHAEAFGGCMKNVCVWRFEWSMTKIFLSVCVCRDFVCTSCLDAVVSWSATFPFPGLQPSRFRVCNLNASFSWVRVRVDLGR